MQRHVAARLKCSNRVGERLFLGKYKIRKIGENVKLEKESRSAPDHIGAG